MKRYWLVTVDYYTNDNSKGSMNFGFTSNDESHISRKRIREIVEEHNRPELIKTVIITNLFEFKSEEDYNNFWS